MPAPTRRRGDRRALDRTHPVTTSGGTLGLATGIAALAGASPTVLGLVGTAAGLVPAAIHYVATNDGIRGLALRLWRGQRGQSVVAVLLTVVLVLLILWLLRRLFY